MHIALNAKGERVNLLVNAAGQLIPVLYPDIYWLTDITAMELLGHNFYSFVTVANWKSDVKTRYRAVRFQRVTLIGESK